MGTYRVFHRTVNRFSEFDRDNAGFVHAANVQAGSLDEVYLITNTVDHPWTQNEGVDSIVGPTRSTSVGDEIEAPDGSRWAVASRGFKRVS